MTLPRDHAKRAVALLHSATATREQALSALASLRQSVASSTTSSSSSQDLTSASSSSSSLPSSTSPAALSHSGFGQVGKLQTSVAEGLHRTLQRLGNDPSILQAVVSSLAVLCSAQQNLILTSGTSVNTIKTSIVELLRGLIPRVRALLSASGSCSASSAASTARDLVLSLGNLFLTPELTVSLDELVTEFDLVAFIVEVMVEHETHADVLDTCCYALANMTAFLQDSRHFEQITETRNMVKLLGALRERADDSRLMESATCLFVNLSAGQSEFRQRMADGGVVAFLVNALGMAIEEHRCEDGSASDMRFSRSMSGDTVVGDAANPAASQTSLADSDVMGSPSPKFAALQVDIDAQAQRTHVSLSPRGPSPSRPLTLSSVEPTTPRGFAPPPLEVSGSLVSLSTARTDSIDTPTDVLFGSATDSSTFDDIGASELSFAQERDDSARVHVVHCALQALGNMAVSAHACEAIVRGGAVSAIVEVLQYEESRRIVERAMNVLSNVTAGLEFFSQGHRYTGHSGSTVDPSLEAIIVREYQGAIVALCDAAQSFTEFESVQIAFLNALCNFAAPYHDVHTSLSEIDDTLMTGSGDESDTDDGDDDGLMTDDDVPVDAGGAVMTTSGSIVFLLRRDVHAAYAEFDREWRMFGLPAVLATLKTMQDNISIADMGINVLAQLSSASSDMVKPLIFLRAHVLLSQLAMKYNSGHSYEPAPTPARTVRAATADAVLSIDTLRIEQLTPRAPSPRMEESSEPLSAGLQLRPPRNDDLLASPSSAPARPDASPVSFSLPALQLPSAVEAEHAGVGSATASTVILPSPSAASPSAVPLAAAPAQGRFEYSPEKLQQQILRLLSRFCDVAAGDSEATLQLVHSSIPKMVFHVQEMHMMQSATLISGMELWTKLLTLPFMLDLYGSDAGAQRSHPERYITIVEDIAELLCGYSLTSELAATGMMPDFLLHPTNRRPSRSHKNVVSVGLRTTTSLQFETLSTFGSASSSELSTQQQAEKLHGHEQGLTLALTAMQFVLAFLRGLCNALSLQHAPDEGVAKQKPQTAKEAVDRALHLALAPPSPLETDEALAACAVFALADVMISLSNLVKKIPRPPPTSVSVDENDLMAAASARIAKRIASLATTKLEVVAAVQSLRSVAVGTGHLTTRSAMQLRRAIAFFSTRVKIKADDEWKNWLEKKYRMQALHQRYVSMHAQDKEGMRRRSNRRRRRRWLRKHARIVHSESRGVQLGVVRNDPPAEEVASAPKEENQPQASAESAPKPDPPLTPKKPKKTSLLPLISSDSDDSDGELAEQERVRLSITRGHTRDGVPAHVRMSSLVSPRNLVIGNKARVSQEPQAITLCRQEDAPTVLLKRASSESLFDPVQTPESMPDTPPQAHARTLSLDSSSDLARRRDSETRLGALSPLHSQLISSSEPATPADVGSKEASQGMARSMPTTPKRGTPETKKQKKDGDTERKVELLLDVDAAAPSRTVSDPLGRLPPALLNHPMPALRLTRSMSLPEVVGSALDPLAFPDPSLTPAAAARASSAAEAAAMSAAGAQRRSSMSQIFRSNSTGPLSPAIHDVHQNDGGAPEFHGTSGHSPATQAMQLQIRLELPSGDVVAGDSASESGSPGRGRKKHMRHHTIDVGNAAAQVSSMESQWFGLIRQAEQNPQTAQAQMRQHPEAIKLMHYGVPLGLRGRVWMILSGALAERRRYPADYYSHLIRMVREVPETVSWRVDIQKDIRRTLPKVPLFQTEQGLGALERVLSAYVLRNPETVGYCQSMNMVAGALLTQLSEEDAFWVLCCMVERRMGYYARSMCGLTVDQRVLQDIFAFQMPEVHDHLQEFNAHLETFCVRWFLCLFVEAPLELTDALQFWDHLLFFGDQMLFGMSLAILKRMRTDILATDSLEDLVTLLMLRTNNASRMQLDIGQLLEDARTDTLVDQIAALREYHQTEVLEEKSRVDQTKVPTLVKRYRLEGAEEVQSLWTAFLSPRPWSILLTGCITSIVWFHRAFCPVAFPRWHRRRWRDHGLLSGTIPRVFQCLDTSGTHQLSFDEYLAGVYVFTRGSFRERLAFSFRFCDMDGDGFVSRDDLTTAFIMIHEMFNGSSATQAAQREAELFCSMIFDRARFSEGISDDSIWSGTFRRVHLRKTKRARRPISSLYLTLRPSTIDDPEPGTEDAEKDHVLGFMQYCEVITFHPLLQLFFGLEDASNPHVLSRQLETLDDGVRPASI